MADIIMGIETSGIMCGVAWAEKDCILLEYKRDIPNRHGEQLAVLVRSGLHELDIEPSGIDAVAIATGPGSFTGLRIGMAFAKGFCFGLEIPLIPVANFEVLAMQAPEGRSSVYALVDARRGNYYYARYDKGSYDPTESGLVEGRKFTADLQAGTRIVMHDGAMEYFDTADKDQIITKGRYGAGLLCMRAREKGSHGRIDDIDSVEPLYIQKFAGVG